MISKEQQESFYIHLGKTIKHYRTLKGKNQEDLAQHVGLSRISIVNIEKGIQKVQIHTLIEISTFLDFNLNDLKLLSPGYSEASQRKFDQKITDELPKVNDKEKVKFIVEDFFKLTVKRT